MGWSDKIKPKPFKVSCGSPSFNPQWDQSSNEAYKDPSNSLRFEPLCFQNVHNHKIYEKQFDLPFDICNCYKVSYHVKVPYLVKRPTNHWTWFLFSLSSFKILLFSDPLMKVFECLHPTMDCQYSIQWNLPKAVTSCSSKKWSLV